MSMEEFIIEVFFMVDEHMKKVVGSKKFRQRGFLPKLSDSEVITMEIVGEFLGMDKDTDIFRYFKSSWHHFYKRSRQN